MGNHRLCGQAAGLARADDQHRGAGEVREDRACLLSRDGGDGECPRGDRRLRPGAPPGPQRRVEEPRYHDVVGVGPHRGREGGADLPQHFGLAQDHGVDAAGDGVEVSHGLEVAERVEVPPRRRQVGLQLRREEGVDRLVGVVASDVELQPVAGGQQRSAAPEVGVRGLQERDHLLLGHGESFSHVEGRGPVAEA